MRTSAYNVRMKAGTPLTWIAWIACVPFTASLLCPCAVSQSTATQMPAFESASVKPAPPDAPQEGTAFMIGLGKQTPPQGLLTMTSPLAPFIMFAYNVQDEVEARAMRSRLPEWAQRQKFTVVARPPRDAPTLDEIRIMLRGLLEDRFALKAHRETHIGTVNTLIAARAGVTGPGLKPHDATQVCMPRSSNGTPRSPEPGKPGPVSCGLELHQTSDGMFHVRMIDVSLAEACTLFGGLGGVLGGRGMQQVSDHTRLTGNWDITLDFLPQRDGPAGDNTPASDVSGPSFTDALERQLGLRLRKGTGQVEDLIVDRIAQPTAD